PPQQGHPEPRVVGRAGAAGLERPAEIVDGDPGGDRIEQAGHDGRSSGLGGSAAAGVRWEPAISMVRRAWPAPARATNRPSGSTTDSPARRSAASNNARASATSAADGV